MNKTILPILFTLLAILELSAQQLSLFTQYRDHAAIINPAMVHPDYLAYEKNISFGVSYRNQWVSIANHPVTQTIHGDYIYTEGSSIALLGGAYLINDQTGPTGFTGAYAKIGGVITEDPYYGGISIALNVGLVQYRIKASEIYLRNKLDIVPLIDQSKVFPDVGLGIFYYKRMTSGWLDDDYIYAGLSVPQIIGLDLQFTDLTGDITTKRVQHAYLTAGCYLFLRDEQFVEISTWAKYAVNVPISADFNVRYQTNTGLWVGTGASTNGIVHLETGFMLNERFRLGYGFDYSFSNYGPAAGSSHEINLNMSLER